VIFKLVFAAAAKPVHLDNRSKTGAFRGHLPPFFRIIKFHGGGIENTRPEFPANPLLHFRVLGMPGVAERGKQIHVAKSQNE